jgi:hypothetical protein
VPLDATERCVLGRHQRQFLRRSCETFVCSCQPLGVPGRDDGVAWVAREPAGVASRRRPICARASLLWREKYP